MDENDTSATDECSENEPNKFVMDRSLTSNSRKSTTTRDFSSSQSTVGDPNSMPDLACLDSETQERLQTLLHAAGISKSSDDTRAFRDPELLKRLTSSVSSALDEAAAALSRMKSEDKGAEETAVNVFAEISSNGTAEDGESMLSLACSAGYYELVQVLLAMRTNIDDRGSKNDCTPLMEAASAGHADIVKLLIAHGADMNAQSSTGNTPLIYACAGGHEEVVRVLLKAGADVTLHNQNGHTPLMEAATAGHVAIAGLLVDDGAYSQEFKVGLDSPLTLASYKGHLDMVKYLLMVGASSPNPGRQEELHTALMEASIDGHVDVARLLFDAGAQVNLPTDSFESPLTLAACGGHVELAQVLLERGANLEEPNDDGYTPLMEAARDGHDEMVTLLLDWGAAVNAQTEETGETALTLACCGGHTEVAQLLLGRGADIELGANTPLMEAAQEGRMATVNLLLAHGAESRARTAAGDTPLTYAAENGHDHVCTLLLDAGAGPDSGTQALLRAARAGHASVVHLLLRRGATDANAASADCEQSALSQACAGGHLCVVELLLRHGADPNKKLKDGGTCIMEAAKGGHTSVVHLLLDWPNTTAGVPPSPLAVPSAGVDVSSTATTDSAEREPMPAAAVHLPSCAEVAFRPPPPIADDNTAQLQKNLPACSVFTPSPQTPVTAAAAPDVLPQICLPSTSQAPGTGMHYSAPVDVIDGRTTSGGGLALPVSLAAAVPKRLTVTDMLPKFGASKSAPASLAPTSYAGYSSPPPPASAGGDAGSGETIKGEKVFKKFAEKVLHDYFTKEKPNVSTTSTASTTTTTTTPFVHTAPNNRSASGKMHATTTQRNATIADRSATPIVGSDLPAAVPTTSASVATALKHLPTTPPCSPPPLTFEDLRTQRWLDNYEKVKKKVHELAGALFTRDKALAGRSKTLETWSTAASNQLHELELDENVIVEYLTQEWLNRLSAQQDASPDDAAFYGDDPMSLAPPLDAVGPLDLGAALVWHNLTPQQQQQILSFQFLASLDPAAQLQFQQQAAAFNSAMTAAAQHQQMHFLTASRLLLGPQTAAAGDAPTLDQTTAAAALASFYQAIATAAAAGVQALPSVGGVSVAAPTPFRPAAAGVEQTPGNIQLDPNAPLPPKVVAVLDSFRGVNGQRPPFVLDPSVLAAAAAIDAQSPPQFSSTVAALAAAAMPAPPAIATTTAARRNTVKATQTQTMAADAAAAVPAGVGRQKASISVAVPAAPAVDLNTQTETNHDTALTLACAGGHADLVLLLLNRGANLEHQDKKGFTPLILAATAGHVNVVELLLQYGANPEAQSERTKDTALSLACSSGKREVVELLLKKAQVNKEHRNVSDYTPLSLAASGGFSDIVSLLLQHGAEINSRTGSKLGISPLMLASMNGHVQVVKLLLEKSADINAQIETNRNTALTLACFQGRHEVVRLLLQYGANVEHRAKTGLTPLMEAASGGYIEVGRILLEYGADPNSTPVPSSRDTALTIAADKGHAKFVELLLYHEAQLDCKTKKGCTALWLASNGGFADVVQALVKAGACPDAQDNRKVSPLMAAFRKSHLKVVKYLVRHVQQFPSDAECTRFLATVVDKDVAAKCKLCMELIMSAKERQAQEANKAAAVLLQELEQEQQLAETRRQAKQRQKEKRKAKRRAKKAAVTKADDEDGSDQEAGRSEAVVKPAVPPTIVAASTAVDTASSSRSSSSRSCSPSVSPERRSSDVAGRLRTRRNDAIFTSAASRVPCVSNDDEDERQKRVPAFPARAPPQKTAASEYMSSAATVTTSSSNNDTRRRRRLRRARGGAGSPSRKSVDLSGVKSAAVNTQQQSRTGESARSKPTTGPARTDGPYDDGWSRTGAVSNNSRVASLTSTNSSALGLVIKSASVGNRSQAMTSATTARTGSVLVVNAAASKAVSTAMTHRASQADDSISMSRDTKKQPQRIYVSSHSIARVIGRGGSNINAIRESSGAHIEVEKQQKGQTDRLITIRGSMESVKQAILMINGLINDPDVPVQEIVSKVKSKDSKALEFYAKSSSSVTFAHKDLSSLLTADIKRQASSGVSNTAAAFPEMSVWQNANTVKSKATTAARTRTTQASVVKGATTVVNTTTKPKNDTASVAEYTPFSTPNVWFSRAAAAATAAVSTTSAASAGILPSAAALVAGKMTKNFASVAAANLTQQPSTVNSLTQQSCLPSGEALGAKCSEDPNKAPGYRAAKNLDVTSYGAQKLSQDTSGANVSPENSSIEKAKDLISDTSQTAGPPTVGMSSIDLSPSNLERNNAAATHPLVEDYSASHGSATDEYAAAPASTTSLDETDSVAKCLTNFLIENSSTSVAAGSDAPSGTVAEGRRSAGAESAYFSPIAVPRPASAMEGIKTDKMKPSQLAANTLQQHQFAYSGTNSMQSMMTGDIPPPPPLGAANFMPNLLLPTPIGGERRSKTNLNLVVGTAGYMQQQQTMEALPVLQQNAARQRPIHQPQETWECPDPDWLSNFSGLSANLAQLQAMQQQQIVEGLNLSQTPQSFDSSLLYPYTKLNGVDNVASANASKPQENGVLPPSASGCFDPAADMYVWMASSSSSFKPPVPGGQPLRNFFYQPTTFGVDPASPLAFSGQHKQPPPFIGATQFKAPGGDPWSGAFVHPPPAAAAAPWKFTNGAVGSTTDFGAPPYGSTAPGMSNVFQQRQQPPSAFYSTAVPQPRHQSMLYNQAPPTASRTGVGSQNAAQHGWSGWN